MFQKSPHRQMLEIIREIIKEAAPEAEEVISYNMPALKLNGILLYYAASKNHIGLYPANTQVIPLFKKELTGFETSKGTIRFPIDKDLPIDLIRDITLLRLSQNLEKKNKKTTRKSNK